MKTLVVRQPWASMIARGVKTIEVRSWRTTYRGDLLIAAAKSPKIPGFPTGVAVAVVHLADIRQMTPADVPAAGCGYQPDAYAWVLGNIRHCPPIPVKGRLRLFDSSGVPK